MKVIDDCSKSSLLPFIEENVEKGSKIITDKWSSYASVSSSGYDHESYKISEDISPLNNAHRVVSLVKRWITGTLQTRIGVKHCQEYFDEYVFRFNRRNSKSIGRKFFAMMEQIADSKNISYNQIIRKELVVT